MYQQHRPAGTALTRRHVLTRVLPAVAVLPALGGCSLLGQGAASAPDPLPGLADAARADAALTSSVITADPSLRVRLEPLRAARTAHATAIDRMLGRPPGTPVPAAATATATSTATATTTAPARSGTPGVAQLHDALAASAAAAGDAALTLDADQVGLVASVAACCAAYAALV